MGIRSGVSAMHMPCNDFPRSNINHDNFQYTYFELEQHWAFKAQDKIPEILVISMHLAIAFPYLAEMK